SWDGGCLTPTRYTLLSYLELVGTPPISYSMTFFIFENVFLKTITPTTFIIGESVPKDTQTQCKKTALTRIKAVQSSKPLFRVLGKIALAMS
ncbi:MAG: hypothetical protein IJ564_02975, partial [Alphaproteobacteria bacterium]|nr:hypothetical protein [Alphaproteobacteria bacterium]